MHNISSKFVVWGFLEILRQNIWMILNIGAFIVPLNFFRFQSGPSTRFILRKFSDKGDVSFWDAIGHKFSKKCRAIILLIFKWRTAGESFISLQFSVFEIILEKMQISEKFDL